MGLLQRVILFLKIVDYFGGSQILIHVPMRIRDEVPYSYYSKMWEKKK